MRILFSGLCWSSKMLNRDALPNQDFSLVVGGQRRAHSHTMDEAHRPARLYVAGHGLMTLCTPPYESSAFHA